VAAANYTTDATAALNSRCRATFARRRAVLLEHVARAGDRQNSKIPPPPSLSSSTIVIDSRRRQASSANRLAHRLRVLRSCASRHEA